METKIKNLLARLAFFAEDGMAEAPIVAIAKDADALLKEMCRAQPEPAQQAEPVAWLKYPRKKPELMQVSLSEHLPVVLKNSGWVSEPLYAHPPAQQQAEPVAAQCRFEGEEWKYCTIAHHLLVQAHPKEWPHYETRALYAQPPAVAVAAPDGYALVPIKPSLQQVNDQFVLAVLNWWWHRNNATPENTLCHELEESGLIPDWFKSHWIYQQDRTPNFGVHSSDIAELIYRAMLAAAPKGGA